MCFKELRVSKAIFAVLVALKKPYKHVIIFQILKFYL